MFNTPPKFWQKPVPPLWAMLCLSPVAWAYQTITQKRLRQKPQYHAPIPVICVGNITMGGAGKTPVVHALVASLKELGFRPAILLRGYGGKNKKPLQIDTNKHTNEDVGDEALLHTQHAPTWISANRAQGAKAIVQSGLADVIVLDDGLQNPQLYYDMRLAVVDTSIGLGNGCLFPLGPLRETLANALHRVDAIVQIGAGERKFLLPHNFPVWRGLLQTNAKPTADKYLAFAGIGYPQKFYNTLADNGFNIVATHNFADHHVYSTHDLETLQSQANTLNAQLITTEKDWVRLDKNWQAKIAYLPVALMWQQPQIVQQSLKTLQAKP